MLKHSIIALAALTAAGFTSNLKADQLFDWSFTTTAGVVDGSGTMTVDTSATITVDGYNGYAITSMSGTYGAYNDVTLQPTGTYYADNLLASLTPGQEQLDHDGITFSFNSGVLENLWVPHADNPEYVGQYGNGSDSETVGPAGTRNNGTFVATAVAVPEPANVLALVGTAGISLLFAGFSRK